MEPLIYWVIGHLNRLLGGLFLLLVLILVDGPSISKIFSSMLDIGKPGYTSQEGVSDRWTSTTGVPPKYALHVLFIGNSFTFFHDIPRQLVDIASSDPGNDTQLMVQSVTRGGVGLKELWIETLAAQVLKSRHWDYVVVQQQSGWAFDDVEGTKLYAEHFDKLIKESGAKTLLYLTWPNKPGSHWYTDPGSEMHDASYTLDRFTMRTYQLAQQLGAEIVPVGMYWMQVVKQQPTIELYEEDEHHPSVAGSYLSALVFYKTLTEHDITKIHMCPFGVSTDAAQKLRLIVSHPLPDLQNPSP